MMFHQNLDHIFTPREGPPGLRRNQVRRLMKSEEGLVLVAVDNGKVVGYSLAEIRMPNPVSIGENMVTSMIRSHGSHRRRGIGRIMLVEIMNWFRSNKIRRVELIPPLKMCWPIHSGANKGFEVYLQNPVQK